MWKTDHHDHSGHHTDEEDDICEERGDVAGSRDTCCLGRVADPVQGPSEHTQDPSTSECRNDQSEQNEERRHGAENSRNDDFPRAARD